MADNTELASGSGGDTIATDDISGVKYPRSKIVIGADGTNDGDVSSANPLPVTGTITAVTTITNPVTVDLGANNDVTMATLPDTAAGDLAAMVVDLAALEVLVTAGNVDLAAIEVLLTAANVDHAANEVLLTTIAGDTTSLDGKVTECNTGAVVISSGTITSITNSVTVADGGGSLTVDGTVTANAGTNLNTSALALETGGNLAAIATDAAAIEVLLGTIDADTSSLAGAVSGTEMQVDVVGSLPAGTNAIGKLAANSGVDIGDVDVTSIAAGTNTIGGVIAQQSTSTAYDGTTATTIKRASGLAASGTVAMVAAVAGKKIRIHALALFATSTTVTNVYVANADNNIFGDASNTISLSKTAAGDDVAGFVLPWNPGGWAETDTENEALNVVLSAAEDVIYAITYTEVS